MNTTRETKAAKKPATPPAPGAQTPERKSMKMEADELTEKIKACVKEALAEQAEAKAEGEDDPEAVEAAPADISSLIEQAMAVVSEKRKSRKDAGEEVGDISADEILEAVAEIVGSDEAKENDGIEDDETKGDDEEPPEEKRKSAARPKQTKAAARPAATAQRKYASIYMSRPAASAASKKAIPPAVQLARAIKCLDVFGRHDPEAASFYAQRKYDDSDMAREFKALSATNPAAGGYLIPEIYLDQIIELLYSKTVIFELGAQKVPMANGNLTIPKMTGGARATWGGEQRKIAKTQPTFGSIKMSSKRLEAIVPQTRELLMSTNFSADQIFANDLTRRMELGIDFGGMFGKGGEFQPMGIFNDAEVEHLDATKLNNTDLSSADGKITADFPVFIRSKLMGKNVDDQKMGWTFNSILEGYLMNLKTTTGAYIYREEMTGGKLLGFPYRISNQILATDAGITELCFGNWADLLVGEQLGLETYTTLDGSWVDEAGTQHNAFEENLAATRALMYVDIAARHKESFLHVKNIKAF